MGALFGELRTTAEAVGSRIEKELDAEWDGQQLYTLWRVTLPFVIFQFAMIAIRYDKCWLGLRGSAGSATIPDFAKSSPQSPAVRSP